MIWLRGDIDPCSAREPHYQRYQIYIKKKRRTQDRRIHGCFYPTSYLISTQRHLLQPRRRLLPHRLNNELGMGQRGPSLPYGCCKGYRDWYQQRGSGKIIRAISVSIASHVATRTNSLHRRQATPKTQENYGGSGLGLFISRKRTWPFIPCRSSIPNNNV